MLNYDELQEAYEEAAGHLDACILDGGMTKSEILAFSEVSKRIRASAKRIKDKRQRLGAKCQETADELE